MRRIAHAARRGPRSPSAAAAGAENLDEVFAESDREVGERLVPQLRRMLGSDADAPVSTKGKKGKAKNAKKLAGQTQLFEVLGKVAERQSAKTATVRSSKSKGKGKAKPGRKK